MKRLVQKFLEDDERARSIIAGVGIVAGVLLLITAMLATFVLR